MAREYSPFALNIYIGCSHQCRYCYAPHTLQKSSVTYFGKPEPRKLAPNVELLPEEKNPDEYIVRATDEQVQTSLFDGGEL